MRLPSIARKLVMVSISVVLGIMFLITVSALAADQDMIVMKDGNTLVGQIVFGIPAVLSVEDPSGNTFTVNQDNVKVLRFGEYTKKQDVIETFDGNILTGQVGGIPDVLGLQTSGGDALSVKKVSIKEIRFGAAVPSDQTISSPQPIFPSGPTANCGQRPAFLQALASAIIPGLGQVLNGE